MCQIARKFYLVELEGQEESNFSDDGSRKQEWLWGVR